MRDDASFFRFKGMADPAGASFESRNLESHFLRHRDSQIFVEKINPQGDQDRKDSTFRIVDGLLPLPPEYCQYSEEPYSSYADKVPVTDADVAGWTWGTPQAAVYWWMNHDPEDNYARNGHRAAILNPDFKDAGPGVGRYIDGFGNRAATFTLMLGAR